MIATCAASCATQGQNSAYGLLKPTTTHTHPDNFEYYSLEASSTKFISVCISPIARNASGLPTRGTFSNASVANLHCSARNAQQYAFVRLRAKIASTSSNCSLVTSVPCWNTSRK